MKTRKGGNLATRVGRAMGIYHEPSTSNLMRNFFAIHEQLYVNVRPILREWVVETNLTKKVERDGRKAVLQLVKLDPRYEQVFLEIYCKVFKKYNPHFEIIVDFETTVRNFVDSKHKQDVAVIETLTIYAQKYLSRDKKIPNNLYDYMMDWIDVTEVLNPTGEIVRLKNTIKGKNSGENDPSWDSFLNWLPKPPKPPKLVRVGGDPNKEPTYAPNPVIFDIFITIVEVLIKVFIILVSGGMVNPF